MQFTLSKISALVIHRSSPSQEEPRHQECYDVCRDFELNSMELALSTGTKTNRKLEIFFNLLSFPLPVPFITHSAPSGEVTFKKKRKDKIKVFED